MLVGKYSKDPLTGLEYLSFPTIRFVVNRHIGSYLVEFGEYIFDETVNIFTLYLNRELYEDIQKDERDVDMNCQFWLQHNLPKYNNNLSRKMRASEVYIPHLFSG